MEQPSIHQQLIWSGCDLIGTQSCSTNRCVREHSPGLHPVQVSEIGTHIVDSGTLMKLGYGYGMDKRSFTAYRQQKRLFAVRFYLGLIKVGRL